MSRVLVAEKFVWSHYPGLRAGRLFAGKPDITRHPTAGTHVVEGSDVDRTVCGRPRSEFPHEFPESTALGTRAEVCPTCRPDAVAPPA